MSSYIINHATLWWLFHIFAIFWKIQFPFHARRFDNTKRTKYIHATFVVLAVLLPVIPAAVIASEAGFITPRFPPIVCIGRESAANFYGIVFPIAIMYALGTTVLLAILWKIRRVSDYLCTCMDFSVVIPSLLVLALFKDINTCG